MCLLGILVTVSHALTLVVSERHVCTLGISVLFTEYVYWVLACTCGYWVVFPKPYTAILKMCILGKFHAHQPVYLKLKCIYWVFPYKRIYLKNAAVGYVM